MLLFHAPSLNVSALNLPGFEFRPFMADDEPTRGEPCLVVQEQSFWDALSDERRARVLQKPNKLILTHCQGTSEEYPQAFACLPLLPGEQEIPLLSQFVLAAGRALDAELEMVRTRRNLSDITQITLRLSSEKNPERLLELILQKARDLTNADGGSLYLVEDGEGMDPRLRFKLSQSDSIRQSFKEFTVPISRESTAGYAALTGESIVLDDAYAPRPGVPYQHNPTFDLKNNYRTVSMLTVPLSTLKGDVLGVLQLINRKRRADTVLSDPQSAIENVLAFSSDEIELVTALASSAAVTLEKIRLYEEIQTLFEGFVKASVKAIEARDPVTSGHSERVATLTVGLAEVVDGLSDGPLALVHFKPEDLQTIRYAGLLHDFGKVGVREHVLVKAKKLYPGQLERIELRKRLIASRMEAMGGRQVIQRLKDARREEFDALVQEFDRALSSKLSQLDQDFALIVQSNEPSVMKDEGVEALTEAAKRTWLAEFDQAMRLVDDEEVKLLRIPKGTLNEAERLEIESHVSHTFQYLKNIPWTKEMRGVPDIAHAHHEKCNGKGYPQGLKADEIPIESKMMAIADVYDALTARDRPYKPAVPNDRALKILGLMVKDGEIDPALFDLFVQARVFQRVENL